MPIQHVACPGRDRLGRFIGFNVEPLDALEPAKPGPLALAETSRENLDLFDRVFEAASPLEVVNNLGIAECLTCLEAKGGGFGQQTTHLVDQTVVDHLTNAAVDSMIEVTYSAPDTHEAAVVASRSSPLLLQDADGLAAEIVDLQCALDATQVVRMDACSRIRIHRRQLGVQRGHTLALGPVTQLSPKFEICRGTGKQTFGQCLEVEGRAADDKRAPPAGVKPRDHLISLVHVLSDAEGLGRLDHIDQMVGDSRSLMWRRLGGADVHASIDHHRIGRDDLGAEPAGQAHADVTLAAGRAADQQHERLGVGLIVRCSTHSMTPTRRPDDKGDSTMRRAMMGALVCSGLVGLGAGCKVEAPREINVGTDYGRSRQARIDSTQVPSTASHAEARHELKKAYYRIGQLEREKDRLQRKYDECKDKYEREKDKYKDLKDKYDD